MKRASAIGVSILGLLGSWRPALAQCPGGTPPPCRAAARPAPAPAANTIAVLYFDNLSRDTADVYLADGFTEELISRLSQVDKLQVKSRTTVQRLRGRADNDPVAIGRSLGVAQLLSGSVLRSRGRLRVNVELTRVATGNSVWGRSFDRPADDLIGVEAEVAESIAVNVGGRLAPAERRRIEARPTRNAAAYDHLLRGRFEVSRGTTAGMLGAIREFEAATRLDSTLTSALVGAARTYSELAGVYYGPEAAMSRDSLFARARRALDRAIRQDSMSAEVLMARAAGVDQAVSRPWLARAVALEPRNAEAHFTRALGLRILLEDPAATAEFKRAVDLEPDRALFLVNLGQTHLIARRFVEAQRWLDSAVALRPEAPFYYLSQAFGRLQVGDTAGARATAALVAGHGSVNGREEILALIEARAGDSVAARARLVSVETALRGSDCIVSHECLELSFTLASVGARERALAVFERMSRERWLVYWSSRPEFDAIRREPRFQRVLAESRAGRAFQRDTATGRTGRAQPARRRG
jgi:TolB-like protein